MGENMAKKEWTPKTDLGRRVANGEITNMDAVIASGKRILEPEIVDALLPELIEDVLEVRSTQRMTASGRKQQMRAIVLLGNKHGYVGCGIGKASDSRDAIAEAVKNAKKNIVKVNIGCGSWECGCGTEHSLSQEVYGKCGSTEITIKPAPRGVGLVANDVSKKVLMLAGVKDAWTFCKGRTNNMLNMVLATLTALGELNRLKKGIEEQ